MDIEALMQHAFADDETLELQAALISVLILDVEEARLMKNRVRNPSRLYLCRPQLLPNPRVMTPWTQLYESYNDRAYITTMGFDITTFHQLLDSGFTDKWNPTPIPPLRPRQTHSKGLEAWREVEWDEGVMFQCCKGRHHVRGKVATPHHDRRRGEDASLNGLDPQGSSNYHARCKILLAQRVRAIDD
jgi:hypothetical protein